MLSVFCAVEMDLKGLGYDSGNYWYYRDRDLNGLYERMEEELPSGGIDGLFLAITSLKDPGHAPRGKHTLEMFTFVPYGPFARWKDTQQGERGAAYERFKAQLGDQMIAAAENVIPNLSRHVVFRTVGTPVTNDFYCMTPFGATYGTRKTPWQLGPFSFSTRTSVPGLFQCGASTLSHGVAGAAMSGLSAAKGVLGIERVEDLLGPADGSLRTYPADRPEEWLREPERPAAANLDEVA
jgi:phytoene dehydrogenase-like protein